MIDDLELGYVNSQGGVFQPGMRQSLPVSPNPSSAVFSFSYPSAFTKGYIQLFNALGKKINELPLQRRLDLSAYPSGLYYYRALVDEQVFSGVLVKE